MFQKGDTVYAVVNGLNPLYDLMIVSGTVYLVEEDSITVKEEKTPLVSILYKILIEDVEDSVFYEKDNAVKAFVDKFKERVEERKKELNGGSK